jgi:hypothetical protein
VINKYLFIKHCDILVKIRLLIIIKIFSLPMNPLGSFIYSFKLLKNILTHFSKNYPSFAA